MDFQPFRPHMNIVYRQGRVHEDVDVLSRASVGDPEAEIDDGIPEIPRRHVTNVGEFQSQPRHGRPDSRTRMSERSKATSYGDASDSRLQRQYPKPTTKSECISKAIP